MSKPTDGGMKYPPSGEPFDGNRRMDRADREILQTLAESKRCQQRIRTDGGRHYVFCGGYFHGKAIKTKAGYRCEHHRA